MIGIVEGLELAYKTAELLYETVQTVRANQKQFETLNSRVQGIVQGLGPIYQEQTPPTAALQRPENFAEALRRLNETLQECLATPTHRPNCASLLPPKVVASEIAPQARSRTAPRHPDR